LEFVYFIGGFILLVSTPAIKKDNAVVAHIAVLATLFLAGFAIFQLATDYQDEILSPLNIGRFIVMLMNIIALVFYIKRFIHISKMKKQNQNQE
jgi:hypothetical protein